MTSLVCDGTEAGNQDWVISGFYGPGGWAAWCISLIASWAPILLEDDTHNLHLIAYALYMNWAAIDSFRYLSSGGKLVDLASRKEALERERFVSVRQDADTLVFLQHWPSDWDKPRLWDVDTILTNTTLQVQDAEIHIGDTTEASPGLWDFYSMPTTEDLTSELARVETQLAKAIETFGQQQSILSNQMHQLQAALAVLNLGMPHAWMQMLVCIWKTHKDNPSETVQSSQRRILIITTGLVLPSIMQLLDAILHNGAIMTGWSGTTVFTMGLMITTTLGLQYGSVFAPLPPHMNTVLKHILATISALLCTGCYALLVLLLRCTSVKGLRCGLMPHTHSEITELDQAFALFAALLYFLYEFGSLLVSFFGFLRLQFEKLLFGNKAHHTTWAGVPLGLPY